jgi:hypothetical protein
MNDGMMAMDVPGWLTVLAWTWVALCVVSAAVITLEAIGRGRHRSLAVMDVVWPVSALYLGPLAVALYRRWGQDRATPAVAAGGLAGGAASAVAHLIGVPLVIATGLTIAGIDLWPMIAVIAVIATALLAGIEAAAGHRVPRAAVLALLTVLAFDIGMGGWMLLLHFTDNMPSASHIAFWFLMQLGIVLGTLTALPVVRRLTSSPAAVAAAA